MSRSLYSGANKAYFRAYLVYNIVASSAYIVINRRGNVAAAYQNQPIIAFVLPLSFENFSWTILQEKLYNRIDRLLQHLNVIFQHSFYKGFSKNEKSLMAH